VPYVLTSDHLWSDKATYTEQGPTAGQAVPQGAYSLAIQTAGTQSASKQLRVRTQRGGQPGADGGAEFIYRYEGDTNWRGQDIQPASSHQVIRSTTETLTSAVSDPDATAFYSTDNSDRICAVYQRSDTSSGTAYIVEAATYDPSAGTWSKATIYSKTASPTDGYHPAIAYNRVDGYLYCCHWIYDGGADLAQIATHRSKDGATWETVSEYALDTGVDISGSPGSGVAGYEVGRLRMAFNSGQCLLLARLIINDNSGTDPRDYIGQWASTSRGARFSNVEIASITFGGTDEVPFSNHSITVSDNGAFVVVFPGQNFSTPAAKSYLYVESMPNAFTPLSARIKNVSPTTGELEFKEGSTSILTLTITYGGGQYTVTDGDGTAWVDESGAMFFAARMVSLATKSNAVFMLRSGDNGETWKYLGNGDSLATRASDSTVVYTGDGSTYLSRFVGVSHRGRQVLIGLSTTDVTSSTTLSATFLGGHSTVTLPGRIAYPAPYQRSGWTESYLPFELPANVSSIANSGTGTDTIGTDGLLNRSVSSNTFHSTLSAAGSVAQGVIARMGITVSSGGSLASDQIALLVRSADGSDNYSVSLRFTTSGFRMWDNNAGSQVSNDKTSVAPSGGIDVLVAIAAGKLSVWFRAYSSLSDRSWTSGIQGHSLTAGGGSTDIVRFGTMATATAAYKIHEVHYMDESYANGNLGAGQTNPDDLRGRTFSRRGRYIGVDDGVRMSAVDGSAMADQSWNIDSAADHPISRIFHRESPSPRTQWRSTAVTSGNVAEQLIPFVLNKDATTFGAEEQGLGSTMAYIALKGINWSTGAVQRWDTGSSAWATVATISNQITTSYSYTRRGSELHPPSLPTTSSGRYLYENECAGWTVRFASGICRKITGNTAGTLASNVSGPKPTFFLDGIDGSEPATTTLTLIPSHVCVMFHTDGETGGGWALKIDAQTTAPYKVDGTAQYDLRVGHLSLGRMFIFGTQYGRGRVTMYESGDLTEDTPGGTRRTVRAGPGGRTVRIAWPDPVDTTQTQGISADPDYITSTTTAGNTAVAARKDVPFSLLGLLQRVGARDPVAYFSRIERSTGAGDTQTFVRHHTCLVGTITSAGQFESVVGDEDSNTAGEAMRFSTVVIEELR